MEKLRQVARELLNLQHFDYLAVGVVDFSARRSETILLAKGANLNPEAVYFDLASLSKPLTLSLAYLKHPGLFGEKEKLLLNHEGGLPSGGRLSKTGWKEQILSYEVKKAPTLYSDYSALRLMLELEEKSHGPLKDLCSEFWSEGLSFWKDLPAGVFSAPTGFRFGHVIQGQVHDDNAFVINDFCSHAGLFGTIDGVCKTLLKADDKLDFVSKVSSEIQKSSPDRFVQGWDRISKPEDTLAGEGCSPMTFGHLGFTGTSIWIDPEKKVGAVILTNATQNYWWDRRPVNNLRKTLNKMIWHL
jgi:CubicO group peptidase (beta-lactamase class C family)